MPLKGKDLLTLNDITKEELMSTLKLSREIKNNPAKYEGSLKGKILAMIFSKTSTRTRVSLDVAMSKLGGHSIYLNWTETNFVKGALEDGSKVLGKYVDAVSARVYTHDQLVRMAEACEKPVINAMSDLYHPLQALADLLTIWERKGKLSGLKVGWVGDGTNVCNSLIQAIHMVGSTITVATPKGYEPLLKDKANMTTDPKEAAKDADVLVTDTWVSLGLEKEKEQRLKIFPPYQLNKKLLSLAKRDCIVLHCLPAQRGYEITSEVFDSPNSAIFQEAENRLYTSQAILLQILS